MAAKRVCLVARSKLIKINAGLAAGFKRLYALVKYSKSKGFSLLRWNYLKYTPTAYQTLVCFTQTLISPCILANCSRAARLAAKLPLGL